MLFLWCVSLGRWAVGRFRRNRMQVSERRHPGESPFEDTRIDVHAAEAAHLDWLRSRGIGVDGLPMRPGHNCPEWWCRP